MKHEKLDDKARVWMITRGSDGRLQECLDPHFLTQLGAACTAEDVANILAVAAGQEEVRQNRAW